MLAMILAVSLAQAGLGDGCTKDADCKGDRICVDERCEWPPGEAPVRRRGARPESERPEEPDEPSSPNGDDAPEARRHQGFFLRLDLGAGYSQVTESARGADVRLGGGAGSFGVHVGAAIADGVILAAHAFDLVVPSPTAQVTTSQGTSSVTVQDVTLGGFGFGPELTFYSGASNLYVSLTAAAYRLVLSGNGVDSATETGFAGRVAVGKEWWVSARWGLGVCAQVTASVNPDKSTSAADLRIVGLGATIGLSATFN